MSGMEIPLEVPTLSGHFLAILVFVVVDMFCFPYVVDYCSFKVCEELHLDFDGDCIESIDCFGRIAIFFLC